MGLKLRGSQKKLACKRGPELNAFLLHTGVGF